MPGIRAISHIILVLVTTAYFSAAQAAMADINSVRVRPSPERTRIVFDLTQPVEHKIFSLANPARLVLDIKDTRLAADIDDLILAATPIGKIRVAQRNGNDLRIVFDLIAEVKPRSFVLQPVFQYGDRLVIDLYTAEQQIVPQVTKTEQISRQMRDIIVALDAGHGGDDPGALGHKIQEKHVALEIVKRLEKLFEKEAGFKVVLIRSGDYYVALRKRMDIARDKQADLLISIHADAFKTSAASGASVYAISERGATSETAKWLAEKENRADLIGGVGGVSLDDKDDLLAGVLLDLSMTASLSSSLELGDSVLKAMNRVTKLHKHRVEQAGFAVLKSPDIPSILVETGYISNPGEARKLNSSSHQNKLARAIFEGTKAYANRNPPPGSYLAWKKQGERSMLSHVIQRGDTLSTIAQKYRVSTHSLRKVNKLHTDVIRIGQVLQIPTT